MRTPLVRKASRIGLYSLASADWSTFWNSGDSSVRLRIQNPNTDSGNASRNGMRQAHCSYPSGPKTMFSPRISPPAKTPGSAVAAMVMHSHSPRRSSGACSSTKAGAPTDSPPAENPWMRRKNTSRTGAANPMAA